MFFRDESSNSINIYRGYSQNLLVLIIFAIIVYPEQWRHLFARNIHEFPDDMNITSNVIDCYIRRFYSFFVCIYDDQTSVYYLSSMKYSQPIFITSRLALLWHYAASVDCLTVLSPDECEERAARGPAQNYRRYTDLNLNSRRPPLT